MLPVQLALSQRHLCLVEGQPGHMVPVWVNDSCGCWVGPQHRPWEILVMMCKQPCVRCVLDVPVRVSVHCSM
jgi:hypothetical protein